MRSDGHNSRNVSLQKSRLITTYCDNILCAIDNVASFLATFLALDVRSLAPKRKCKTSKCKRHVYNRASFRIEIIPWKIERWKIPWKKLGKYYPFKLISIDRYSVEQLWTHNHQQIKQKKKFILTTVVVYIRGYFLSTYFKMTTICGEESQTRHSFFTNSPRSLYIVTCKKKRIQLGRNDTLWWKHYIFFSYIINETKN